MKQIPLTRGMKTNVDDVDYEKLSRWKWHAVLKRHVWYAARTENFERDGRRTCKTIFMHRQLMGFPSALVDHRDRDGLNNTRGNLRLANRSLNARNCAPRSSTGYRGVTRRNNRFRARILVNGRTKNVGTYDDVLVAARAYDAAAREIHGDGACVNFVEDSAGHTRKGDPPALPKGYRGPAATPTPAAS